MPSSVMRRKIVEQSTDRSGPGERVAPGTIGAGMQRIAITGIGSVSPVGLTAAEAWDALLAGRSGIAEITQFDASDMPVRVAGEVKGFDPVAVGRRQGGAPHGSQRPAGALGRAKQAAEDAALIVDDPTRFGVLFGTAIGGFHTMMEQHEILRERGWERVAPWFLPQCLPDVASGAIAQLLDLRGHNMAPISACSTGAHAVMEAAELIRRGDADVVLAGGGEACIHPLIIAGFTTMKGLGSPRPGEGPETASRPFDATRDGFVCSEGATVLVLESVERAERRGARIHAEVVAGGNTNDAYHAVTPRPDSLGVVTMMRVALAKAGVDPSEIGYINPHGTSTPQGDAAETKAIKEVFGDHAHTHVHLVDEVGDRPPVRRRGVVRGRRVRARAARPDRAADAQLPRSRPRLRPRLRARGRAEGRRSSTRSRTRWASAATTAASSCAATDG